MVNDMTVISQNDGWGDAAAESAARVIKGSLLKFSDWRWIKGKDTEVDKGMRLVALGTRIGWVKWSDGKPIEYKMCQPGQQPPEREELGDLDQDLWKKEDNEPPQDPWQLTRFVYLVDPVTAEAYTFSTHTWGGRQAVSDLAEQIQRVRSARPGTVPLVELDAAPMPTKHGKKSKPFFKVIDWRGGEYRRDDAEIAVPAFAAAAPKSPSPTASAFAPAASQPALMAAAPSLSASATAGAFESEMDDAIPF